VITAVIFVSIFMSSEKLYPVKNFTVYLMFTFFLWTFATCFVAIDPVTSWDFFNLTPLKIYVYLFTIMLLVDREERLLSLLWIIVISLGYYGASIGIVGIKSGGGNLGTADNFGPVGRIIQDRNHMAVALLMMFPFLLYFHKYTDNKLVKHGIKLVSFLTLITVFVSYSRTGILCLGVIGGYYFMFLRNKIIIFTSFIVIFVISFTFMPPDWQQRMSFSSDEIKSEGSLDIRLNAWNLAQAIANDHPVTGGGFRIVQNSKSMVLYPGVSKNPYAAAAHSIYFEVLSDHGYVGLILFIALILNVSYLNLKTRRMTKNMPEYLWIYDLATALQLAIVVYAVGGAALSLAYYDVFYIFAFASALLHDMLKNKLPNVSKYKTKKRFVTKA